jgi:hypothetical protein
MKPTSLTAPSVIDSFRGPYAFLSNFYHFDCSRRSTVEHYYQAAKATTKLDEDWILSAPTPVIAKSRGRQIKLCDGWEEKRDTVMLTFVRLKFRSNTALARLLIDTYPSRLVEGNHWGDTYWGVCRGVGKNRLGEILMRVRAELLLDGGRVPCGQVPERTQ